MSKMQIEIWSDIACPFCFIGKRKLEMALNQFEHKDKIELVWYSYELDPSLPKKPTGKSFYQYLADKYNTTVDAAKAQQAKLINMAAEVGLKYDYDNLIITNTSDALRLVKFAAKYDLATEAEEVLFSAYFEQGKDISDKETLIILGASIGLESNEISQMLDSDKYYDKIRKDTERADEKFNLQYIPFYRLNYNQIIQGSIPVEDYLKAIQQAYSDWENGTSSNGDTISGQSCSIDGVCS